MNTYIFCHIKSTLFRFSILRYKSFCCIDCNLFSLFQIDSIMLFRNLLGPLVIVVLLDFVRCSEASTPLPKVILDEVESNLLSLFGMQKKPKIDRSQIVIPDAMLRLYEEQIGHPYDTIAIPRPGMHTNSANTVRSFSHLGE